MNWITIQLMKYQLKKAEGQQKTEENSIVKRSISEMVKSYKESIMFLKANG